MGPIKATNWAFRILLSWGSVSDIVQLQDLHQTAFISSLNWDVGEAIKSRKGSLTKHCCDSLISDTPRSVSAAQENIRRELPLSKETLYKGLPLQKKKKVNPSWKQF